MTTLDRSSLLSFCTENPWSSSVATSLFGFLRDGLPFDCAGYNTYLQQLKIRPCTEQGTPISCVPVKSRRALARKLRGNRHKRKIEHEALGYQQRIYLTGELETREHNAHDLFNLMVWVSMPELKAVHNSLCFWSLLQGTWAGPTPNTRSRLGDGLTLLDESRLLQMAPSGGHLIFGHALLEHLWKGHPRVHGYLLSGSSGRDKFATDLRQAVCRLNQNPTRTLPLTAASLRSIIP